MKWPFLKSIEKLHEEAKKPENRGYADNRDDVLKEAAARYLDKVCGVKGINPATEVLHSIGSKAALSILPACFINPGDYVLMTTPGYPVFGTHAKYFGGLVHNLKLTEENNFLPDLDNIPADVLQKAKVLVINYPNNPTGASATPEFYAKVVEFAKKNQIIVVSDAAYAALVFDRQTDELSRDTWRKRGRHRTAFHEQEFQHDRLALRVCCGK